MEHLGFSGFLDDDYNWSYWHLGAVFSLSLLCYLSHKYGYILAAQENMEAAEKKTDGAEGVEEEEREALNLEMDLV